MTPVLLEATKVVQEQWSDLPIAKQDEIVAHRNAIVSSIENSNLQLPKGLLKAVGRTLYSLKLTIYQPELRRFAVAVAMFIASVDTAIANERKSVRQAEAQLAENQGCAIVADGVGVEFDPGELLRTV